MGKSEAINRRRIDNAMVKGKGQTMIYNTLSRKLNIEQQEPHYKLMLVLFNQWHLSCDSG